MANHPDTAFVSQLIYGIENGLSTGYQGNEFYQVVKNWPSTYVHREKVRKFILDHAARGRLDGPYYYPPHPCFRGSALGAFLKKRSLKARVIHDLSYPPGSSINEFINKHDFPMSYVTIDQVVKMCAKYKDPYLVKLNVKDAYMHCIVKREERHLLGFTWEENGVTEYWQMCCLPFGLSSSPKLFNDHACALEYMMIQNGASEDTTHYMDDFISVSEATDGARNKEAVISTTGDAGFDVQHLKTEEGRIVLYTGIVIDTINKQLKVSEDRLSEIRALLRRWYNRRVCSKRQLLSLLGKLQFCNNVVRDGRKFIGRLILAQTRLSICTTGLDLTET